MAKRRTTTKKSKPRKSNDEVRKQLTGVIHDAMSKDLIPWRKPWSSSPNTGNPCNFASGRRYTGINPVVLYWVSLIYGYESRHWGSGSAWSKQTGGHIVKGEESTHVVLFNMIPKKNKDTGKVEKDSDGNEKRIPIMREFPVFNVEQIQAPDIEVMCGWKKDGVTKKAEGMGIEVKKSWTIRDIATAINEEANRRLDAYRVILAEQNQEPDYKPAEELIAACGVKLVHRGSRACYEHTSDQVTVPNKRTFTSMGAYYETVFHELIHWTGNRNRLNRRDNNKRDSYQQEYAFEELVAEIGACFLCAELNIPHSETLLEKSQSYLQNWLSKMGGEPKYIFDASSQASAAADYLLKYIGKQNPEYQEQAA